MSDYLLLYISIAIPVGAVAAGIYSCSLAEQTFDTADTPGHRAAELMMIWFMGLLAGALAGAIWPVTVVVGGVFFALRWHLAKKLS